MEIRLIDYRPGPLERPNLNSILDIVYQNQEILKKAIEEFYDKFNGKKEAIIELDDDVNVITNISSNETPRRRGRPVGIKNTITLINTEIENKKINMENDDAA